VPTPPVLKALPKIFAHSDKTVRAEGSNLTLVLYQYLGPGIESWLGELKPVQVKELKDSFENLEKAGQRSQISETRASDSGSCSRSCSCR
jgi:cytoskeleton-associated protein 5